MAAKERKKQNRSIYLFIAVMKQIQLDASAEARKSCWRRNYKQVRENFQFLKFWMLGCTTSITFQSFRSASTCSLAKPGLSFLLSSFNFCFFLSDSQQGLTVICETILTIRIENPLMSSKSKISSIKCTKPGAHYF